MWQEFSQRMNRLSLLIAVLAMVLVGRLAYLQLVRGPYYSTRAQQNSTRELVIDAPRGDIVTADGALLVGSRPAYVVTWMVPAEEADRERVIESLAKLLADYDITAERLRALVSENTWRRYQPIRLATDVSEETVLAIDERRMELSGVTVERQAVRDYPYGNLGSYLVGGLGAISQGRVADYRRAGYRLDAAVGIFGLENAHELVDPRLSLRGLDGYRLVEIDHSNRLIADLGETAPVPGNRLVLTVDSRVQAAAEQALNDVITGLQDANPQYPQKPTKGAAVVLDVRTGAVLAWAVYPSFDEAEWATADYLWTSNIPLNAYPVGSTFKPITLLTGLTNGVLQPDDHFYCPGYYQVGATKKYCWQRSGHGDLSLTEGLKVSCNVVFCEIAQRLVNQFGRAGAMDRIGAITQSLALDQNPPLDFAPGYLRSPGIIPTSSNFRRIYGYTPYPGEVWSAAIGQGIVEFTPLQMAAYVSLLANGGQRYQPYVVQQVISADNQIAFQAQPQLLSRVPLNPTALQVIRTGMHEVTLPANRPGGPGNGSAYYLFTSDPVLRDGQQVQVAAKTGTAEVGSLTPHSWMISYAPLDNPEIALAVFVEHGRSGSSAAVPIGHAIYKAYFQGEVAPPERTAVPLP